MAFVKGMQDCFGRTLVSGLSQGGAAAMLNAQQSGPNIAIVAAGHSILSRDAEWSGHNQPIGVPGYAESFDGLALARKLAQSPTKYLFTRGKGEVGLHLMEAKEGFTVKYISNLPNVSVAFHAKGHVFPVVAIREFLSFKIKSNGN